MAQDIKIDIGEDGGELTIVAATGDHPTTYRINGEAASWQDAYRWIKNWHDLRDALPVAAGSYGPCVCTPCTWTRNEDA